MTLAPFFEGLDGGAAGAAARAGARRATPDSTTPMVIPRTPRDNAVTNEPGLTRRGLAIGLRVLRSAPPMILEGVGEIGGRAGERPVSDRAAARVAIAADPAPRGLDAEDAIDAGGDADRSATVGAEADRTSPVATATPVPVDEPPAR